MQISLSKLGLLCCFAFAAAEDAQGPFEIWSTVPEKYVVAHFMVGNTYPYTPSDWSNAISSAASKGIDAFALNVGGDSWQPDQVAAAFTAAQSGDFKLFLSFDMTSIVCSSPGDAKLLQDYIGAYKSHPSYMKYRDRSLVSTFAGENCRFGKSGIDEAWTYALNGTSPIHFVPSFFVDPASFPGLSVMDGSFNWNSAWPMGNNSISDGPDNTYIKNLGGRTYMAGVSPWFFTHYGADTYNKNFIYRGDNWLFCQRWELLIQNRASIDIAQVITWNDYGESHYIGPIAGAQPKSEAWVDGFDHQGWLDLLQFYIFAFKTGRYPIIDRDRIFLWARLHPARADAPDNIGKPTNWQFTEDYLWVVVLLTCPAQVDISCGESNTSVFLEAGLSKVRLPMYSTCGASAKIRRNGVSVLNFAPDGFTFRVDPSSYNFNAFVAASP